MTWVDGANADGTGNVISLPSASLYVPSVPDLQGAISYLAAELGQTTQHLSRTNTQGLAYVQELWHEQVH